MTFISPIPTNISAFKAQACDGEVVVETTGSGLCVCISFTPEAVMASLEPLREAAEKALQQCKETAAPSLDNILIVDNTRDVGDLTDGGAIGCKT